MDCGASILGRSPFEFCARGPGCVFYVHGASILGKSYSRAPFPYTPPSSTDNQVPKSATPLSSSPV